VGRAFFKKPFVKPGGHGHWNFLSNLYPAGTGIEGFFLFHKGLHNRHGYE